MNKRLMTLAGVLFFAPLVFGGKIPRLTPNDITVLREDKGIVTSVLPMTASTNFPRKYQRVYVEIASGKYKGTMLRVKVPKSETYVIGEKVNIFRYYSVDENGKRFETDLSKDEMAVANK